MKLNPVARRLIRNLLVVLFFGFLSILMGKIRFFIPGYVETVSDLREIILMISVIFSPHWSMAIGITLITSLSSPTLFIYGSMVLNHGMALVSTWLIYHRYVKHLKRIRQIALTWFVFVLFYH